MDAVLLRLLGIRKSDADMPIQLVARNLAGLTPATPADEQALFTALLRARGHEATLEPPADDNSYLVAGAVDVRGRLADIRVTVWSDSLGGERHVLAEASTNVEGEFSATFTSESAPIIRVAFSRERTRLYLSPPRRAEATSWIEWSELSEPVPRPGTYELRESLINAALEPLGRDLADLDESVNALEISTLAETVGISRGHAAVHALSARIALRLGYPRAVLFAVLGRSLTPAEAPPVVDTTSIVEANGGYPADFFRQLESDAREDKLTDRIVEMATGQIVALDPEALRNAVMSAAETGVISSRNVRALDDLLVKHSTARTVYVLDSRPGTSTWRDLLGAVGMDGAQVEQAARVLLQRPVAEPLLVDLSHVVGDDRQPAMLERLRLAALVEYDATAVRLLAGRKVTTGRQFARLDSKRLDALVETITASRPDPAQARRDLIDRLDRNFVSEGVLRRLPAVTSETRAFLTAENRDLLTLNVEGAYRNRLLGNDANVAATVRAESLALQRVARLAGHGRVAAALFERGFTSSAKIALTDRASFVAVADETLSADELATVHRRARAHYRATVGLFLRINQNVSGPSTTVLDTGPGSGATVVRLAEIKGAPSWEFLFGSPDYCECGDCASVTSPAAYLVDLLTWLQRAPGPAPKPFDVLIGRRPDLIKINLNCANTETLVPYIDLVCELLEEAVAIRADARANPVPTITQSVLDQWRRERQTTLTADEIRAYPEHINLDVYSGPLAAFAERMVSPFDLSAQEVRLYLGTQNIARIELMRVFANGTATERAAEQLGIVPAEQTLITATAATAAAQQAQWGFVGPTVPLEGFLRAAPGPASGDHLSYDDLLALLAAPSTNPADNAGVRAGIELEAGVEADLCRATDRSVVRLELATQDRQHRFLRLARHVPLSIAELDLMIRATGGTLGGATLIGLAALLEAQQTTRLSAEEFAFLYLPFTAADAVTTAEFDGRKTLYARTFLSRTDGGDPPAVFHDPVANTSTLAAVDDRLAGYLGVSEPDLALILSATMLTAGNVTFANLSVLYRHARLASALGISVERFELLRRRTGDPFGAPSDLLTFIASVQLTSTVDDDKLLAIVLGDAAATAPPAQQLVDALDKLRASTRTQLIESGIAAPTDAQVRQAILDSRSWTTPVTAWLAVDSRLGGLLLALDDAIGSGTLVTELYTAPIPATTLSLLARIPAFSEALEIDAEHAADIAQLPDVVNVIRAPGWAAYRNARQLRSMYAQAAIASDLVQFVSAASGAVSTREQLAARLSTALAIDVPVITGFWDTQFGTGGISRAAIITGDHLLALRRCAELAAALGATPAALDGWARAWPTAADAVGVRNAIRSRLSGAQWLTTSTQVQDMLREHRRDALVRYLLATAGANDPKSSAELYGALLLDVEMDDCLDTSRIVQANAAIQLFVQRCFLGLEDIARDVLHSDHWKEWDWRQRYRLWEANRLVFLYPENFLNVARRSNASTLFDGYAKEIRQSDKDEDSVRDALDVYLKGLEDISNLDYLAVSSNIEEGAGYEPQFHVVARSRATPPAHFHRMLAGGVWTPWESIDIGTPGNHFALLHGRGKTTLVWPMFADHPDPRQKLPPATQNTSSPEAPLPHGVSYLTYGWVARDRRKWTSVQTSTRALLHQKRGRDRFVTAPAVSGSAVNLDVFSPAAPVLAADQNTDPDAPYLGTMELQRDVVSIVVNQSRRGLDPWLGGDHQHQMDTTATLAPARFSLGADCSCVIWADSKYAPWPGLVFNDNRMRSPLTAKQLTIRVPLTADFSVDHPVLDCGFFVVAADSTRRLLSVDASQSGFRDHTSYVVTQTSFTPASDVFAVNDQYRSLIGFSRAALGKLASQVSHPGVDMVLFPAYHPFASELRELVRAYDDGIDRLYMKQTQEHPGTLGRTPLSYVPTYGDHSPFAIFHAPAEGMDFDSICAYALYNWEVFFHAPLFVAEQLRAAGRFEQARRYYHFIFTPFTSEPADAAHPRARFWVVKPFRDDPGTSQDIKDLILNGAINHTNPYTAIESHPFDAQMVAQTRPSAYQKFVVMRYLDNLMAWGDSLYRKGQREDVYEAIQHYILAKQILGERPEQLRPLGKRVDRPFEGTDWSGGANALVDLENLIADAGEEPAAEGDVPLVNLPLVHGLYFCLPPNKTMLKYWDDIDRRLYNIRHCLTIDGAPVRYDLLAAPIDPQALVDAAAAGVSVAEALTMAGSPIPPHRFNVMWAKAWDACNEVKALGGALLSALEKRDGEQLAAIRSTWEGKLLEKTRRTRELTRDQATADVEALTEGRKTVDQRRAYYSSRDYMNDLENAALELGVAAGVLDTTGLVFDVLGGVLYLIPNVDLGISGFGGTPTAKIAMSGENVGGSVSRTSQGLSRVAGLLDRATAIVSTQGSFARRQEEWDQQAAQASLELAHLDKQIAAANLRIAIANAELRGHEVQEQTWGAMDDLLSAKFSNQERYEYLIEVLSELYRTAYEHAVDMAKLARECLAFELPHATVDSIGTTHWDSLQHGLLAGERLAGDLRDLDRVHATERGYERVVVQHIPLSHVAPRQLIDLRQTGACAFSIPAWWFQRFDPSLTHRSIRSLAVTVPSVTGPYVGMNATLRYQGAHRTRTAISLSTGVNDSGGPLAPDQYAPFEGISLDVQSSWSFGFPPDPTNPLRRLTDVDYSTITDVILHVQYVADVAAQPVLDSPPELVTFIDLRTMAPDAWAELSATTSHTTSLVVSALVPGFLKGYEVDSILPSTIAVLTSGAVVTPKLAITVGTGVDRGKVKIGLAANQTLDWSTLAKVMLAIKMKRPAP
jgi:hypothetical protein